MRWRECGRGCGGALQAERGGAPHLPQLRQCMTRSELTRRLRQKLKCCGPSLPQPSQSCRGKSGAADLKKILWAE